MEAQWKTALTIIVACLAMGSLVLFIVIVHINHARKNLARENQLKSLEREMHVSLIKTALEIEEREKERIYRNFHDEVNPMLRFVMRRIEGHRTTLIKKQLTVDELNEDIDMMLKILESIKTCTYELVPSYLRDVGLFKSLEYVMQKLNLSGGIIATFKINSVTQDLNFSQSKQLNIYRLTLEIITNILTHSGCNQLDMMISKESGNLIIKLKHNGKGVSNHQIERFTSETAGYGLKSSKARSLLLKGKIEYFFSPMEPYVLITVPT